MSDNHKTHELTVIVFTDIVGFTSIMQKDEDRAMKMVDQVREIIISTLPKFQGSLLKEIGDGNLLTFKSAINAVNCSLEIQNKIEEYDGLELRIGVHLGDVIVKGEDVFGSGVNIASRIEQAASAGEICISRAINDQIRNKKHLKTISLGMKDVKGIDEKIEVFKLSKEVEIKKEVTEEVQEEPSKTLMEDLLKRRVPQFIGVYIVAAWTILQIIDWIVNRYILSPYLVDLSLGIIISFVPTILIMAYFHGKPGKDKWTNIEKIGIPINLAGAIIILAIVFYPKDLGAATQTIIVENEDGQRMKRIVPKRGFIKNFITYPFENNIQDDKNKWVAQGIWQGLGCDISQDLFANAANDQLQEQLKEKGFSFESVIPMGVKQSLARELFLEYFTDGEVDFDGNEYSVTINLYTTDDARLQVSRTFVNKDIFTLTDEVSLQLRYDLGIPSGHIESSIDLPVADMLTNSPDAFKEFSKGMVYAMRWDMEKAIPYLEKAIEIDETFAMAHLPLQTAYAMTNQMNKSEETVKKCLNHIYRLPERYHFLPKLIYFMRISEPDKAMETVEIHLDLFPYDILGRTLQGILLLSKGEYEKVIEVFERVLEIDPTRYDYLLKIGNTYNFHIKDYNKAMEYYSQYLDYFPNDHKVHQMLARFYSQRGDEGDRDKARASWNKVALLDPGNITASRKIVSYDYEGLEQIEHLYEILKDCKSPEDSVQIYDDISGELTEYGMYKEALNVWKKYDKIRSGYLPFAMYAFQNIWIPVKYAEAGMMDEAVELMDEYDNLYQEGLDWYLLLTKMMLSGFQEDGENAEKYLNEFIEEAIKTGSEVLIDLAVIQNAFDAEIAILNKDYDKAIELIAANRFNEYDGIQAVLSEAYRLKGDLDKSKEIIETMCDDGDDCSKSAQYEAALVYYDLGQYDKAREYLNGYLDHYKHADAAYKPVAEARETLSKWDAAGN